MPDVGYYAPHETRMLSLEMAVEFVNGGKRAVYTTDEVVGIARKFQAYLTEKPIATYESLPNREPGDTQT